VTTTHNAVAVVTGAARGFGREIASRLLTRGHRVLLTDLDPDVVKAAADGLGEGAVGMAADARIADDHGKVAAAAAELGEVRVWVNNAGVLRAGRVWEQPAEDIALQVDVNLLGVVHGSRAAVEAMRQRGGHLLNIASISALGPVPGMAVYAATKAAVLNFSTSLQGELDLARLPIRVHALCPDAADTALVRDEQGNPDSALLFSQSGGLLSPVAVADAAIALLDGRRVVRSLPTHRAGAMRVAGAFPRFGLAALAQLRAQGDRRRTTQP
jgi:short-subunit dehydrogenase